MATRHAPRFSTLTAGIGHMARALTSLSSVWQRRRVIGQLGALDDHMLRDIGVSRQDLFSVMAEPLFIDPSVKLAERVHESRLALREAARDQRSLGWMTNGEYGLRDTDTEREARHAA